MDKKNTYILELKNVCKTFPKSNFKLDNVSFSVPYGVIMGLVGKNGSGKTTTIKSILDIINIDKGGEIKLFEGEIVDEIELKNNIGVVFDSSCFSKSLTPKQISNIMAGIYKKWDNSEYIEFLDKFDLPINRRLGTFSKGMLMKFSLSVALSHSPKLLILDEVTSGLDPVARDDVLETLMEFIQDEKHSILFSTHITSDLEKISDYITLMHQGKVLLSISKERLLSDFAILRCKKSEFFKMDNKNFWAYLEKDYQVNVLVSNVEYLKSQYTTMVFDKVSIEELLTILIKGESYERDFS